MTEFFGLKMHYRYSCVDGLHTEVCLYIFESREKANEYIPIWEDKVSKLENHPYGLILPKKFEVIDFKLKK